MPSSITPCDYQRGQNTRPRGDVQSHQTSSQGSNITDCVYRWERHGFFGTKKCVDRKKKWYHSLPPSPLLGWSSHKADWPLMNPWVCLDHTSSSVVSSSSALVVEASYLPRHCCWSRNSRWNKYQCRRVCPQVMRSNENVWTKKRPVNSVSSASGHRGAAPAWYLLGFGIHSYKLSIENTQQSTYSIISAGATN